MTVRARFLLAITVMLSAIVAIAQAGEKQPEFTWRDWNSGLDSPHSAATRATHSRLGPPNT